MIKQRITISVVIFLNFRNKWMGKKVSKWMIKKILNLIMIEE